MVSKQSAQNRYVAEITVISCSDRHASPGNWKGSRLRASTVELATSGAHGRDANHLVTHLSERKESLAILTCT